MLAEQANSDPLIPEGIFGKPKTGPQELVLRRFSSFDASITLIRETAEQLGISVLQLGILIAMPYPHQMYDWTSGRKRPSPVYRDRMVWLTLMALKGAQVYGIQNIYWDTGTIIWKENFGPKENLESHA